MGHDTLDILHGVLRQQYYELPGPESGPGQLLMEGNAVTGIQ